MGSNKGWKNKVNMGNKNNRKFYSIPFYTLNSQLEYKLKKKGIQFIRQEESYTSKCDSLANEHINRRQYRLQLSLTDKTKYLLVGKYKGKRIKRGLFKSSQGQIINADLNGAINIYRKALNLNYNIEGIKFHRKLNLNINKVKRLKKIKLRDI
jgi:putative transposase